MQLADHNHVDYDVKHQNEQKNPGIIIQAHKNMAARGHDLLQLRKLLDSSPINQCS